MSETRLHKFLAQAGIGSRRAIERWIQDKRITVNGQLAQLGQSVNPHDTILIDGQPVNLSPPVKAHFILYHKPIGELCTRQDPEGRPTIFEALPACPEGKWINIGRLDLNTSGLLLLTNQGEIANHFMHPRQAFERVYLVRIKGKLSEQKIQQLLSGITLEDGPARFKACQAHKQPTGQNAWYKVALCEGRNRIVRRCFEAIGHPVSRLVRIQYGPYTLPASLKPGQVQWLDAPTI